MSVENNSKKRKREICQFKDDGKYKHGCTTPQKYQEGGVKQRCALHGGYPICQFKDDGKYKNGCSSRQSHREGGLKQRCALHGGVPTCQFKDDGKYKHGCTSKQKYQEGGVKQRCALHGGYPICQFKDDDKYINGCTNLQNYKEGGVKRRCVLHGGYPSLKCDYLDSSLFKKQGVVGELICGHIVKGMINLQKHVKNNHTLKSHIKKKRVELKWLDFLKANGYGVDNDQQARIDHCSSSSSNVSLDKTPLYSSRIDFFMTSLVTTFPKYLVFVEIDENYHRDRCLASEFARMQENLASLHLRGNYPNRSHLVIRLNPDAFKVDGITQRVSTEERQQRLLAVLQTDWSDQLLEGVNVNLVYLFYTTSEQIVEKETLSKSLSRNVDKIVRLPTLFETEQNDYDLSEADMENAILFRKCVLAVF